MKCLGKASSAIFGILLMSALATHGLAQGVPEEVRTIAVRWLFSNCGLGTTLEDELRRAASPALEAFFLEALDKGPDSAQIAELEKAAARRYAERLEALKRPDALGLSRQELEQAQKVTQEEFISQEKKDFVLRYQSQAAAGLGIIGGSKARSVLQGIARDEKSPLRGSAQQALAKMQQRK